jgi:hypothetical protein
LNEARDSCALAHHAETIVQPEQLVTVRQTRFQESELSDLRIIQFWR